MVSEPRYRGSGGSTDGTSGAGRAPRRQLSFEPPNESEEHERERHDEHNQGDGQTGVVRARRELEEVPDDDRKPSAASTAGGTMSVTSPSRRSVTDG